MNLRNKLYYLAGLVDGEGWIGVQKYERSYRIHFAVNMTDVVGINLLQKTLGGCTSLRKFPHRIWKDQHCWRMVGRKALSAIRIIEPFLLLKRKQAQEILKSDWTSYCGKGIPNEERKLREKIWKRLKILNRKGK